MKIIAYTALLYGSDYLAYAIRSVIDYIDEYHVIYDASGTGSHGSKTDRVCPDKRQVLYDIAQRAAGDKLRWHEGTWPYEGAQRDAIYQYAPDADVILVLDADEVWPECLAKLPLEMEPLHRNVRLPMVHFWRSFSRCVLHDPAYPVRVICPKSADGEVGIDSARLPDRRKAIAHFGYAQRPEIVEFKQHTHGHRGQWRTDIDWFRERFMANAQHDCHPVGSEYWNPEAVNPLDYMPSFMSEHPYFGLDVIGEVWEAVR
jgi:hypothetical protein